MHLNSMLLFEKYAKKLFKPNTVVLEIGPDKFPSTYYEIVGIKAIDWQTLDIFSAPNLTYTAKNEYHFPVSDGTFDIVLSGQVLEHVRKPWVWIRELTRICKVGGHIITINPVSWPYHAAPVDCWRIYPEGMKALYEEGGIKVELCKMESSKRLDS
ncbi:MAG: methyltransferase domain-containing protein, partial [Candidatus Omnitrophica bacterium]|nr:methyltransferase domain-containing protein [Candidatus Omnitrophota bacterium]